MELGLLDLSLVTEQLITQLKAHRDGSQLWAENKDTTTQPSDICVTGLAPDLARKDDGCHLSIFLFHAGVDQFSRNTYPGGGRPQQLPLQPLALTLHYLVTAYSSDDTNGWVAEQQAMSIALQFFHENPRITAVVPLGARPQELTVTFEPQTFDEVGRIWQALAQPMRMAAVYRAAVVLLKPPHTPTAPNPPPHEVNIEAVASMIGSTFSVDANGLATVSAPGAGFERDRVIVFLHSALGPRVNTELVASNANPPPAGRFFFVGADELVLRIPANTQPHGYQLLIRPAPGKATLTFWLVVPEP